MRALAMTVYDAIVAHLERNDAPFRHLQHEPTRTSEDSARVRGESMVIGGKSLVLKAADRFLVLVLSAALRADSKGLRKALGVRRLRFATRDELHARTRCVPGCVPPFGRPIVDLPLLVDTSILANDRIAFNAGTLTDSIIMARSDWQRCVDVETIVDVATS